MNTISNHFIGCGTKYSDSDIVIFGAPYDGTASFRPGSRFAPEAIRQISDGIETYSPAQDVDIENYKISDIGDIHVSYGNKKEILAAFHNAAKDILKNNKKFLAIGGEHLISYPLISAVADKYEDVFIIHADAHADLRDDYLGEKLSHATVMRRVADRVGIARLFQFGIRSGTKEEYDLMRNSDTLDRDMREVRGIIGDRPVYLSIDIDVLDPSVLPGTGTPEPGGWQFDKLMEFIYSLKGLNIISADVVELSPHYDSNGVSTVTAAKIIREMLPILNG